LEAFYLYLAIWWVTGLVVVLHEMRQVMDINPGCLLAAAMLAGLGPLWPFMTSGRMNGNIGNIVLLRKK